MAGTPNITREEYEKRYGHGGPIVDRSSSPPPGNQGRKAKAFRRLDELDLRSADLEADVEVLSLDKIRRVSGLEALSRMARLSKITAIVSGAAERERIGGRRALAELRLQSCSDTLTRSLLDIVESQYVHIEYFDTPLLDLTWIRHPGRITYLRAWGPLIRGSRHLCASPIRRLVLQNVVIDGAFRDLLRARTETVVSLHIENEQAFGPGGIPELEQLPHLRSLAVCGYPEYRQAWIDFAVAHPALEISFLPPPEPLRNPVARIADVYRGIDILEIVKGKKRHYEIQGNIAGDVFDLDATENDALAEELAKEARAGRLKLETFASSDELTVTAGNIETLRWAIDRMHQLAAKRTG